MSEMTGLGTTGPRLRCDLSRPAVRWHLLLSILAWGLLPAVAFVLMSGGQIERDGPGGAAMLSVIAVGGVIGSAILATFTLLIRPVNPGACIALGIIGPAIGSVFNVIMWGSISALATGDTAHIHEATRSIPLLFMFGWPVYAALAPFGVLTLFAFRRAVGEPDAPPTSDG